LKRERESKRGSTVTPTVTPISQEVHLPLTRAGRQRRYRQRLAALRELGLEGAYSELPSELRVRIDRFIEERDATRTALQGSAVALWRFLAGDEDPDPPLPEKQWDSGEEEPDYYESPPEPPKAKLLGRVGPLVPVDGRAWLSQKSRVNVDSIVDREF
jgi:hypothetical protein